MTTQPLPKTEEELIHDINRATEELSIMSDSFVHEMHQRARIIEGNLEHVHHTNNVLKHEVARDISENITKINKAILAVSAFNAKA